MFWLFDGQFSDWQLSGEACLANLRALTVVFSDTMQQRWC